MIEPGKTLMFAEAAEAGAVVARQLADNRAIIAVAAERLRETPPTGVLTCARGSSDHAATYAKYLIETRANVLVASAAPSIASIYRQSPATKGMLAIGISQSGKSPDIVETMRVAGDSGATTLALVNVADSPLAQTADMVFPLLAGPEISVAATKSYIAALAGIAQLVAAWTRDDVLQQALEELPALLQTAWQADWTRLVDRLVDARGLYIVGRGVGLGIAQEAALKLKETCGLHAEAFSAAEVRHGPMALVGPGFPLLVIGQSDEAAEGIDQLVAEMVERGGDVLVAGRTVAGAETLPVATAHPVLEPILAIQSFYRAANALSVRRGFDPDRPPHLAKVTETV
ncbi:SIS domain-containing protein [uncultured Sphingomonas sp.]|uniref:SIS domain-containing protein n=1 Tax=uncultured Sphingomonas sp. TaxID=158754 RepID=UPI0025E1DFC6|nr:SIS domain-containing protein [uncultured Sphingomonas sp.]